MRDYDQSAAGRSAVLFSARTLYDELFEKHVLDCEWQPVGMFMVYKTEKAMAAAIPLEEHLKEFGVVAETLSVDELVRREPALREDVFGAHFFPQDAHLRPDRLVKELARVVRERGAVIEEGCKGARFRVSGGKVEEVTSAQGNFRAIDYVVATGAWTPKVVGPLDLKVPIQPGTGYSVTIDRPEACPTHSCILNERNMAVTPWPSGLRLGGTMEFGGYREGVNEGRVDAILEGASEYFRESFAGVQGERWFGWRPMTTDGMPIIGRSPNVPHVFVAAGHGMLGVSMAPSTGKLMAALVTGVEPPIDPMPYRLDRF